MVHDDFIGKRITQLRIKKGVSEYKMSLDLGHSKNYIQHIANGHSRPSVTELMYICEYFGVEPKDFFDEGNENPALVQRTLNNIKDMDDEDLIMLNNLIERWYKQKR